MGAALVAMASCTDDAAPAPRDGGADVVTVDAGTVDVVRPGDDAPRVPTDGGPRVDVAAITGGFVDLSAALNAPAPFALGAGDGMFLEPESTAGLFADLDRDGVDEVIVCPTMREMSAPRGRRPAVYRFDRAGDRLVAAGPLTADSVEWTPMAVLDLDGDGHLDVLSAGELGRVAWGLSAGGFAPIAPLFQQEPNGVSVELSHVALDDLDGDGWLDVLVASRFCNEMSTSLLPLLRVGPRRYEAHPEMFPEGAPRVSSYSVQVTEFQPGEKLITVTGLGCSGHNRPRSFAIQRGAGDDGRPRFPLFEAIPRDSYFGMFRPEAMNVLADFSPMASAVGDINNDGRLDLAVSIDPYHAFYEFRGAWPFVDVTERVGFPQVSLPSGSRMIPWGMALLDLDRDGRIDVISTHGNDQSSWYQPTAFIGPQFTTAHLNDGERPFVDVSERLGLSRLGQWRTLTAGDLDRDGAPDLIVGGQAEMPRVYRNAIRSPHAGFALRLRGTTSNSLGVGARVTVLPRAGAPEQLHVASSLAVPYVHSEPLVFVGLGQSTPAERVTIRWPSGVVQVLRNVATGALHEVVEPSLFTLDPPTRRVAADGAAAVTIRITPRNEDGSLRAASSVSVTLRGPGALAGPARQTAEGWEARVVAPSTRGSTLVDITIDGATASVHPRLWWD